MKLLTVVSAIDFVNFTRRATIDNIYRMGKSSTNDILMYTSLKNICKEKRTLKNLKFNNHYFWVPERLKKKRCLARFEHTVRGFWWRKYFSKYDTLFLTDPNQFYLLPYIGKQKVVYLIRDPHCLFDKKNWEKEIHLLKRADIILCTAQYLASEYIQKYYNIKKDKVFYWPNTVDLKVWDTSNLKKQTTVGEKPIVGIAGNFPSYSDDLSLIDFLTRENPDIEFHLSGKISSLAKNNPLADKILNRKNFIVQDFIPFDDMPRRVMNWDIGIVVGDRNNEIARYINNNKQYQYLAMGKPFVTYNIHGDYDDFEDMVFIANDHYDFSNKIREAINRAQKPDAPEKGLRIARKQSAEVRARQFWAIIDQN